MRRRAIKQGTNTLTITLPSEWARQHRIMAGSELDVVEKGPQLLVSSEIIDSPRTISIHLSGLPTVMVWRKISAAYRAGYDEIKVTFKDKRTKDLYSAFTYNTIFHKEVNSMSTIEIVQALVNRFVGMEIIDQGNDYCVMKELHEISAKEFENAVRRIFLLLISMSELIVSAAKGDRGGLKQIHLIDTNLDRFEDFCIRVLNKRGYEQHSKLKSVYLSVFFLELLGDRYKHLALTLLESGKPRDEVQSYILFLHKKLKLFYELYYAYTDKKAGEMFELHKAPESELGNRLRTINQYLMSLTEIRIDQEYM